MIVGAGDTLIFKISDALPMQSGGEVVPVCTAGRIEKCFLFIGMLTELSKRRKEKLHSFLEMDMCG